MSWASSEFVKKGAPQAYGHKPDSTEASENLEWQFP